MCWSIFITVIKQPERWNEISLQQVSLSLVKDKPHLPHSHRHRQRHNHRYRHANTKLSICRNQFFAAGNEIKQFSRKFSWTQLHVPGDDLLFWSSGASSLLLSTENRCRLECVQKHNQSIKPVPILGLQYFICLSCYIGQVKSSLFLQGGPFKTRLLLIRSLKKNATQFCWTSTHL